MLFQSNKKKKKFTAKHEKIIIFLRIKSKDRNHMLTLYHTCVYIIILSIVKKNTFQRIFYLFQVI